jgi:putative transposase
MSERKVYPSDVTDAEWSVLEKVLPAAKATGRPRKYPLREMVNAMFYLVRSGCPWRYLPEGFAPWQTVYSLFRAWEADGTWEQINTSLTRQARTQAGREARPSAGVIDSQSVKTTRKGGRTAMTAARKSTDANGTSW